MSGERKGKGRGRRKEKRRRELGRRAAAAVDVAGDDKIHFRDQTDTNFSMVPD